VPFLLDTNVAIHLRDGDPVVTQNVAALKGAVLISVVTRVELKGGVYREPAHARIRRARLDAMLAPFRRWASMILRRIPTAPLSRAPATRGESCSTA
jgi:predicted nucleic acid-binding protein